MQGSITLPEDLNAREARRIGAFVATLALEEEAPRLAIEARRLHDDDDE
jgi:hypothetical protein